MEKEIAALKEEVADLRRDLKAFKSRVRGFSEDVGNQLFMASIHSDCVPKSGPTKEVDTFLAFIRRRYGWMSSDLGHMMMTVPNWGQALHTAVTNHKLYKILELSFNTHTTLKMPNPEKLFNRAEAFKARGDYPGAFHHYLKAAEKKHELAQFEVGAMYYDGVGVEKDYVAALRWFHAAAEQGNTESELNLGTMYSVGQGVDPNPDMAYQWYLLAAQKKNVLGEFRVGLMLYEGTGVKQDHVAAFQYLCKAANKGDFRAQFNVGVMYFKGEGVQQSYSDALRYYCLASEQNHPEATHNVALMFEEGVCMPPNEDEAFRYYLKAAELGLDKSQYNLARLIHICGKDLDEALYWYHTAAVEGHTPAMCALGDMCFNGDGVDANHRKALRWYRKAVTYGDANAQRDVDNLTLMMADAGDAKQQLRVGKAYADKRDYDRAVYWFGKAADQGYPKAIYNLAVLLDRGLGCAQDKEEAARLFEAASPFRNA